MAKKKTSKGDNMELLEDPGALVSRTEDFFSNERNRNLVFGIGGVITLAIIAFLVYNYLITSKNTEAQKEMFQAVYYFEADSLGRALNGDGNNFGFLQIIEDYSGTEAANLSTFYAGAIYMKLADFESAKRYLDNFNSDDYLLQARAYALSGDASLELGDFSTAESKYEEAANYKPNKEFTPIYLQKLAIARENNGNYAGAAKAYTQIVDEYFNSSLFQEAKKQKARLEGLAAQ